MDCLVTENPILKPLGIVWNSQSDLLTYMVQSIKKQSTSTKRRLLSDISKIFDPLGLLGPVILFAKVLMQDCWKAKITWDESLPQEIHTKWKLLAEQLPLLQGFSIPRQFLSPYPVQIELHGFCDACAYGYGACIFARCTNSQGIVTIRLVCGKSRVAPLSGVTIPRLELCAASVLKKLYVESKTQFEFPISRIIFWSDSTIVLFWLKKAPHLLNTFESNKVADIQTLGDEAQWRHVRSKDNPADALSRGQLPSDFIKNSLWTSGPAWLSRSETDWPKSAVMPEPAGIDLALKKGVCLALTDNCSSVYTRFSSFSRFSRVVAYMLRWRIRKPNGEPSQLFPEIDNEKVRLSKLMTLIRPLLCREFAVAELRIVAMVQKERFSKEIKILMPDQNRLPMRRLFPFKGQPS